MKKITAFFFALSFLLVGVAFGADVPSEIKAWSLYNTGDYKEAYAEFSKLRKEDPKNASHALGLAYSADKLGKLDEALTLAEEYSKPGEKVYKREEFLSIKRSVLFKKGNAAYEAKDYKQSAAYLQRLYDLGGADNGQTELLAWSYYNDGEIKKAAPYFNRLREKTGEERFTEILFTIYERLGSEESAAFVLGQSKKAGNEKDKKRAALFFYTIGCPVIAAGIDSSEKNCFYNADKPGIELGGFYRHKSGTSGTSKLGHSEEYLRFDYPFQGRYTLGLKAAAVQLDAGDINDNPDGVGTDLVTQLRPLTTDVSGFYPEITLKREGVTRVTLAGGRTPSGGDVSASLTGSLRFERRRAYLEVYRKSVDETVLSFVGLKDPYGTEAWGRVVRSGIEGEKTFLMDKDGTYWVTLKGGYDSYKGKNVVDNSSYNASLTLGGSYDTILADVYAGVFASYLSFDENTNFFTFGHGGYFSPERFFIVGPFVNVSTKPCKTFKAAMEASIGYRKYTEEASWQFPLGPALGTPIDGGSESGVGFDVAASVKKLFYGRLVAGVSFDISKSADFTEWKAGATLTYHFEPVNAASMY